MTPKLIDVGIVTKAQAFDWAFSGVMLRGSGVLWDLRLIEAYDNYNLFNFSIPVGLNGDCYDRYLIRVEEMRESISIIFQSINILKYLDDNSNSSFIIDNHKIAPPSRSLMKFDMNL